MSNKVLCLLLFIILFVPVTLSSQTLTQIGFVVKKAIPDVENIAVLCHKSKQEVVTKEAQTAFLVNRKKFHVYTVEKRSDLPKALTAIRKLDKVALVIVSDELVLSAKSVKYIAQKLVLKKIPVISNRNSDTLSGALLVVRQEGDKVVTHVSKVVAGALKLTLSEDFLASAVIDAG